MSDKLLDWLARQFPTAKRQTLRRMVQARRVLVNNLPATNAIMPLPDGAIVRVLDRPYAGGSTPGGSSTSTHAADNSIPSLDIVFEDADILVVNKPHGLLTSTNARERRPTLLAMVGQYLAKTDSRSRVGLIHRLDRDAAGLLIFSKNAPAYRSLKSQFFHHDVLREYLALVHGTPSPTKDRIETRLHERADGIVYSTKQIGKGQIAITEYEVLEKLGTTSLLRVRLHTGKKHQIRAHLSGRQHPILGDKVYGREGDKTDGLRLLAQRLEVRHPRSGKTIRLELPEPAGFRQS